MGAMEDETKSANRVGTAWIVLAIIAIPVITLFVPARNTIAERSPRTKALNDVKQLLLGCRAYAADHEGPYPPTLDALYPDYIDHKDFFHVHDHRGTRIPFIYHPGQKDLGEPRAILIEHPILFDGRRIVGYVGGHVQEVVVE